MSIFKKQKSNFLRMVMVSTFSLEIMGEVNWHSGDITGLLFSQMDDILTSCARDGTILSFQVPLQKKREIFKGKKPPL